MPEGHILHRLAQLHQRQYVGKTVRVTSPQGRFAAEASIVDNRTMLRSEAHGKHLLQVFGPDATVHVHLGLYGAFEEHQLPESMPTGQVRMRLVGPSHFTDLRGPTKCELLTEEQVAALHARLGPDPLRSDADPERVWSRLSRSRAPIALVLVDQSVMSGVGNAYRAELLFRHQVPPMREARRIDHGLWSELWADLVALMRTGQHSGRIDTVRPEHEPAAMGRPPRDDRHGGEVYVYRRAGLPCLVCGTPVATAELAGRNLYWCPFCQAGD